MASNLPHIVRKLVLEVDVADQQLGEEMFVHHSSQLTTQLEKGIASFFDGYVEDGVYHQIDKLELNLGSIPGIHWEEEVEEALRRALAKIDMEPLLTAPSAPAKLHQWEQVLVFLEQGAWDWNQRLAVKQKPGTAFPTSSPPASFLPRLIKLLQSAPQARKRWLYHAAEEQKQILWKAWVPRHSITPWIQAITQAQAGPPTAIQRLIWRLAFLAVEKSPKMDLPRWKRTIAMLFMKPDAIPSELPDDPGKQLWQTIFSNPIMENPETPNLPDLLWEKGRISLRNTEKAKKNNPSPPETNLPNSAPLISGTDSGRKMEHPEEEKPSTLLPPKAEEKSNPLAPSPPSKRPSRVRRFRHPMWEEGIYIENAGIVLLHPFLPPLFEHLGLIENEQFLSESTQIRAAETTQRIGQGELAAGLNDEVLPRLLCGLAEDQALQPDIRLSRYESEEIQSMLTSMLSYWEVLKGTDAETVRQSFFRREGKLIYTGNEYKLQIQQSAIDILLSKLPWNLSMVRLPWMEKMLWVEWI